MLIGERSDPCYCLNVFPVVVPPLRERREDIPLLVRPLCEQVRPAPGQKDREYSERNDGRVSRYAWPGNIGELQNLIERAVLLSSASSLRLPLSEIFTGLDEIAMSRGNAREQVEREQIVRALRETNWIVGGARGTAARLG